MVSLRSFPPIKEYPTMLKFLQEMQQLFPNHKFRCTHQVPHAGEEIIEVTVEITSSEGDADNVAEAFLAVVKVKHFEWDTCQASRSC